MCGIAGWLFIPGAEPAPQVLDQLSESIRHRGPDDSGEYRDPAVGLALAQRHLSIIDLSPGGHQPMIHPDTGDVLVFNGEIYNFRELRAELEPHGYPFRGHSDTEVFLAGIVHWGVVATLQANMAA